MHLTVHSEAGRNGKWIRSEGVVLVQRDRSRNYAAPCFDVSPNKLLETSFLISFLALLHN